VRQSLQSFFRPEFVNRIDEVIEFRQLSQFSLELILQQEVNQLNRRLLDQRLGIRIEIGNKLRAYLVQNAARSGFGGRALKRAFQSKVIDAVSDKIITDEIQGPWLLELNAFEVIEWSEIKDTLLLAAASES
jgi:ATP-dependent Clp protease ATP-binding subunit ClpA